MATLKGHAIGFQKDQPIHVPAHIVKDALACGAVFVEEQDKVDVLPPEVVSAAPTTAPERQTVFNTAFDRIVGVNNSRDFGANAMPSLKATERETGFTNLDNKDVKAAWVAYREARAAEVS
jgi:hypothetical protein